MTLVGGNAELSKQGTEAAVNGRLGGEQTGARIVLNASGGFVFWQSNAIDANGNGVAGMRIGPGWTPEGAAFKVNAVVEGDQETPDAAIAANGDALVAWRSTGQIIARLVDSRGNFKTPEIEISSADGTDALTPVVASLQDQSFCVAWAQRGSEGPMQDIWFQRITASGEKLGAPTLANQYTSLNQRSPAITRLGGGGFLLAWISEEQFGDDSVDVIARPFDSDGAGLADEYRLNSGVNVCANPTLAAMPSGPIVVAWSDFLSGGGRRAWDVIYRVLDAQGQPTSPVRTLNTHQNGSQYRPRAAASAEGFVIAWTSFGQDGWDEGVFSRAVNPSGESVGDELQVNTTWQGRQFEPALASDPAGNALVVWSAYSLTTGGVDLVSQKIGAATTSLTALPPPYASALTATRIGVAWPVPAGLKVASYEVYFDDAASPEVTANNFWSSKPLTPASTHTARIGYILEDGRHGPLSEKVEATTWGEDTNGDGLPDDWQTLYWGEDSSKWPSPTSDSDSDGVDNRAEFLAGTNPRNAASALRLTVAIEPNGTTLRWATRPGNVYQVLASADLSSWSTIGSARFADGEADSLQLDSQSRNSFYRVTRVR